MLEGKVKNMIELQSIVRHYARPGGGTVHALEGVSLRMSAKLPGSSLRIEPVKMDFHYGTSFGKATPEAYERLLLDAMAGDATLFARRDEVEEAWKFVDAIREAWDSGEGGKLATYAAGTWGPNEADDLVKRSGAAWRRL